MTIQAEAAAAAAAATGERNNKVKVITSSVHTRIPSLPSLPSQYFN